MSEKIIVNEIFPAPQGEGLWAGMPMVFVRLQGCNLRCEFCDTKRAIGRERVEGGLEVTPADLARGLIREYGENRVVCFTGGEPLTQIGSVIGTAVVLQEHGWKVHLETNGTIALMPWQKAYFDWITVSPKGPRWTLAIPEEAVDEVKLVIPDRDSFWSDIDGLVWPTEGCVESILEGYPKALLWFQPRDNEPEAIEWCRVLIESYRTKYQPAPLTMGLSVQVHKYIGSK